MLSTADAPGTRYRGKKRKVKRPRKPNKHSQDKMRTRSSARRLVISALSDASATGVETPGGAVDALLPSALQVALLVECLVVHVALEVRSRSAVVAEHLLHVEELARGLLGADLLAGFVGFAVFGDGVGEGFRSAGVHI